LDKGEDEGLGILEPDILESDFDEVVLGGVAEDCDVWADEVGAVEDLILKRIGDRDPSQVLPY
jgi:hypothetical protein